jgi:hypothetical protein
MPIHAALTEKSANVDPNADCAHLVVSVQDEAFKIDLENNIAVASCNLDEAPSAISLTIPRSNEERSQYYNEIQSGKTPDVINSLLVSPFTRPIRWDMIEGLKFTHNIDYKKMGEEGLAKIIAPFVMHSITATRADSTSSLTGKDPLQVASRGLGQIDLPESTLALHRGELLHDFGIQIDHGVPMTKAVSSTLLKSIKGAPGDTEFIKSYSFSEDTLLRIDVNEGVDESGLCGYEPQSRGGGTLLVPDKEKLLSQIEAQGFRLTVMNASCTGGSMHVLFPNAYFHDSRRPGQLFDLLSEFPVESDSACNTSFFACGFEAELFFNRYLVVWSKELCCSGLRHRRTQIAPSTLWITLARRHAKHLSVAGPQDPCEARQRWWLSGNRVTTRTERPERPLNERLHENSGPPLRPRCRR